MADRHGDSALFDPRAKSKAQEHFLMLKLIILSVVNSDKVSNVNANLRRIKFDSLSDRYRINGCDILE